MTEQEYKKIIKKLKEKNEQLDDKLFDAEDALSEAEKAVKQQVQETEKVSNKLTACKQQYENVQESLNDLQLRETLVGRLISAKNENPDVAAFNKILYGKFMAFANEENSLAEEAKAVLQLQSVSEELRLIGAFPSFHSKRTVAVAGGFSAGKSEFISSLFSNKAMKLPSSIEPTTAIPTYVINSEDSESNSLLGMSKQGGIVDLNEIDENIYAKLTHQFIQEFEFPLKDIMPYMFLTTPLTYQHLCFVDTPGYNPAGGKGASTEHDVEVARTYVDNAEALIWLVGADANGTIPQTDIEFIQKLNFKDRPIYFVLNKVDLRAPSDIKHIIKNFQQVLGDANIPFVGICAYNAIDGVALHHVGKKLTTFLRTIDKPSDKLKNLMGRVDEVQNMYQQALQKEIEDAKRLAKCVNYISFDLAEENFGKGEHPVYDKLDELEAQFDTKKQREQLKSIEKIGEEFAAVLCQVFGINSNDFLRFSSAQKSLKKGLRSMREQLDEVADFFDEKETAEKVKKTTEMGVEEFNKLFMQGSETIEKVGKTTIETAEKIRKTSKDLLSEYMRKLGDD